MIEMPRRSVTRFFIPLIDVMILLFCIFLLLPVFKEGADSSESINKKKLQISEEENKKLRAENEELRKLQRNASIRVLEVEPRTGYLFYYEKGLPPVKREINTAETAAAIIRRDELEVRGKVKVHYVILYPSPEAKSAQPTQERLNQFEKWFRGTPFTLDRRGT